MLENIPWTSLWSTPIGPIFMKEVYFVTRHPLQTISTLNPFASLDKKFWINYALLFVTLFLLSTVLHITLFQRKNFEQFIVTIISPSELLWIKVMKSGILLSCLISFAFWTFNILYGVDLREVLVGQTFEPEVNSWDDIRWFETQFVFVEPSLVIVCIIMNSDNYVGQA